MKKMREREGSIQVRRENYRIIIAIFISNKNKNEENVKKRRNSERGLLIYRFDFLIKTKSEKRGGSRLLISFPTILVNRNKNEKWKKGEKVSKFGKRDSRTTIAMILLSNKSKNEKKWKKEEIEESDQIREDENFLFIISTILINEIKTKKKWEEKKQLEDIRSKGLSSDPYIE